MRALLVLSLVTLASPALATPPECLHDRHIGVVPDPIQCAGTWGGWARSRLFPAHTCSELARYCVFTWTGSGAADTTTLPSWGADSPAPDCYGVTGQGPSWFETTEQTKLESSFRTQVEAVTALPNGAPGWVPTKVVVVDASVTAPFPDPSPGVIDHGRAMGMIVRELACPTASNCRAIVSNSLALPMRRVNGQLVSTPWTGGLFGSFGNVAGAIVDGQDYAATASPVGGPVVMNLSIGWDPEHGGAYPGSSSASLIPPIRAVHSAILYANCRRTLVAAASGNSSNGPDQLPGLSYPGGWEAKPAPTPARCAPLGGVTPGPAPVTSYRRMVYAFGGTDPRNVPLRNRRPLSIPSLVAPGSHATISDSGSDATRILTGSSVATAVASASLAAMWSYMTNATPFDVVATLRGSAMGLGFAPALVPESCGASGCPSTVSRISFCRAVSAACATTPACAASNVVCPATTTIYDARPEGLVYQLHEDARVFRQAPYGQPSPPPADSPCTTTFLASSPTIPRRCPADALSNGHKKPGTGPEPNTGTCPTCPILINRTVMLDISPDVVGTISEPTLVVTFNSAITKSYALDVPPNELVAGALIKITDGPVSANEVASATIDFKITIDGVESSTSDPMVIEK